MNPEAQTGRSLEGGGAHSPAQPPRASPHAEFHSARNVAITEYKFTTLRYYKLGVSHNTVGCECKQEQTWTTHVGILKHTLQSHRCLLVIKTDFLVSDRSCPKTDGLRPQHLMPSQAEITTIILRCNSPESFYSFLSRLHMSKINKNHKRELCLPMQISVRRHFVANSVSEKTTTESTRFVQFDNFTTMYSFGARNTGVQGGRDFHYINTA